MSTNPLPTGRTLSFLDSTLQQLTIFLGLVTTLPTPCTPSGLIYLIPEKENGGIGAVMMRGEGGVAAGTEEVTGPEILLVLETTTGTEKEKETETGTVVEIGIVIEEKGTGTEGKVGTVTVTATMTAIPRIGAGSEVST